MPQRMMIVGLLLILTIDARAAGPPPPTRVPRFRAVDLDLGESQQVDLGDGIKAEVKLLAVEEIRDTIRDAVRRAVVKVEVNGQAIELISATYHLPQTVAGVQVDCPITRGYLTNTDSRPLGPDEGRANTSLAGRIALDRAGYVRLSGSPAMVRQRDPDGQRADVRRWYRGAGATKDLLPRRPGYRRGRGVGRRDRRDRRPGRIRRNDERCPVMKTAPSIRVTTSSTCSMIEAGTTATAISSRSTRRSSRASRSRWARRLGYSARKGAAAAGRTSTSRSSAASRRAVGERRRAMRSSGKPTCASRQPAVIAVARPHHLVQPGEKVTLDGARSWSRSGTIARYDWTFSDGSTASGPRVERVYDAARRVQ